jgi:hypothetical protein
MSEKDVGGGKKPQLRNAACTEATQRASIFF